MYYNRFDIIEAYYLYYLHYHEGQWSYKYERLCKITEYYCPSPLDIHLTDNGKEIYLKLIEEKHR